MCGRASLTKNEKELEQRFKAQFYQEDIARYNPLPNYNVAPTQAHPVITNADPGHIQLFRWGLVPFWARDRNSAFRMINARVETVAEKPAFRQPFRQQRCLALLDGFYEWQPGPGKTKIPYFIRLHQGAAFAAAGLWDAWKAPDGSTLFSFTIITVPPNPLLAPIHDRMPAILAPESESAWLAGDLPPAELLQLLGPYPAGEMEAFPVSARVGKVRENDAGLQVPIGPPLTGPE